MDKQNAVEKNQREGELRPIEKPGTPRVEHLENRVLYSADVFGILPEVNESEFGDLTEFSQIPDDTQTDIHFSNTESAHKVADVVVSAAPVNDSVLSLELAPFATVTEVSHPDLYQRVTATIEEQTFEPDSLQRSIQAVSDNDAPVLTGFPTESPVFIESDAPVLLAPNLVVSDPELDLIDNYDGFTVLIERTNGATASDHFDLGAYDGGSDLIDGGGSGGVIGKILQNSNGVLSLLFDTAVSQQVVQDTLRSIAYNNTDVTGNTGQVELQWTVNDNNDGSQGDGGALSSTYATSVSIVPAFLSAQKDELGTIVAGTPFTIAQNSLLDNDTGLQAASARVIDVTSPNTGQLDSNLVYTSAPTDTGAVSFDYTSMAGGSTLISQWNLSHDGVDDTGPNTGTVYSDSTDELVFDGNDHIELPNIVYPDTFVLTFDFKINNLNLSTTEEVFYAHGEYRKKNSLLVWATGMGYPDSSDRGKLWTYVRDSNDGDTTFGFDIDITGLDHSVWHNYTLVMEKTVGTKIWVDGVKYVDDSRSGADFQPTESAYIGAENLNGSLTYKLINHEISDLRLLDGFDGTLNEFSTAAVSFDLRNEEVLQQSSFSAEEDENYTLTSADLLTTDLDNAASELEYSISRNADYGKLFFGTTELSVGDTFSQQNVNLGDVHFQHEGDESAVADSMELTVDDGEGSYTDVDLQITLTPVNDAPVLSDGSINSIEEDNTDPPGAVISSIFSGGFTDVDGSFDGIAIASNADLSHGAWQYSTNGSNWFDVGSVTESAALMLKHTASLRFVPAANYHGSIPNLIIYGVDDTFAEVFTDGGARELSDVTIRGGSTPYSANDAEVVSAVVSVNDAPVLGDGSIANVDEDDVDSAGDIIANIFSAQFSDSDTDGSFSGIAVIGGASSAAGHWEYSTDAGSEWFGIGTVSTAAAVLLDTASMLRFVPAENFNGSGPALEVHAIDDTFSELYSNGAAQQKLDVTSTGDGTPLSSDSALVPVEVNPVFDPPFFAGALPTVVAVEEDSDSVIDLSGIDIRAGEWGGVVSLHVATSNGGELTAPDENSILITSEELYLSGTSATVLNDYLGSNTISYRHPTQNNQGIGADTLTIRLLYGSGFSTTPVSFDVNIEEVNDLPVLDGYGVSMISGIEDQVVEITVDDLQALSSDVEDTTITAFRVIDVLAGELKIGENGFPPSDYELGANDTIDANNKAYWLPNPNESGELDAFVIHAVDSTGAESVGTATVKADIAPDNDKPVLNGYDSAIFTTLEDTEVALSLDDLRALSNDQEDGAITGLIVQPGSINGQLKIGSLTGTPSAFSEVTNDRIDSGTLAWWTPPENINGDVTAFNVLGIDNEGALSEDTGSIIGSVTPVNDPPTISENTNPLPSYSEDIPVELTLTDFVGIVRGDDVDGNISEIVVESVADFHGLRIGVDEQSATGFVAGVNNVIDSTNHAYWNPMPDLAGTDIEVFTVSAKDDQGLGSSAPVKVSFDITAVNDEPTFALTSVPYQSVEEDSTTELRLATIVSHLGGADVDGHITELVVEQVPAQHTLKIGLSRDTASAFLAGTNDTIDASRHAYWTPEADFAGVTDAFTIRAKDNQGLASVDSAVFQIEVTPVNDFPVLASNAEPYPDVVEDSTVEFRLDKLVSEMSGADVDGDITELVVEGVPFDHGLKIGPDSASADPFEAGVNDTIDTTNHAYWTPPANLADVDIVALSVTAKDNEGLSAIEAAQYTVGLAAVNDAPVFLPNTAPYPAVLEDDLAEFRLAALISHLNIEDVDSDITEILVESVPDIHKLYIGVDSSSATPFQAGFNDTIDDTHHAYWVPQADLADTDTVAFTVTAKDREGQSSFAAAVFNVTMVAVNDAPTISSNTVALPEVLEDETIELRLATIIANVNGMDVDGDIEQIVIKSTLENDGHHLRIGPDNGSATEFVAGDNDTVDQVNHAYWSPGPDYNGLGVEAFTIIAVDDEGLSSESSVTVSIDALPVNDAPIAVNNSIAVSSGTISSFQPSDFGFDDSTDNHELSSVTIGSLPATGQLLYQETPVVVGQEITVESILAGYLSYVSPATLVGDSETVEFEFAVRDDGGTDNGGTDLSIDSAVLRINIAAVDQPPVIAEPAELPFYVEENAPAGTVLGALSAIDPDPVFSHLHDGSFSIGADAAADVTRYDANGGWFGATIGNWDVVAGNVEVRGDVWEPGPAGGYPIDLNGNMPGAIEQQLATKTGAPYSLNFVFGGNFRAGDTSAAVEVSVGDQVVQLVTEKTPGWSELNIGWQQHSIPFIATGPNTTVSFRSLDDGFYGPLIADITVYDELDFSLVDSELPFRISDNNQLIATEAALDYEMQSAYDIEVQVSELNGQSATVTYPVEIIDLNESPEVSVNSLLQTIINTEVIVGAEYLSAIDEDGADQHGESLVYTLSANTSIGQLLLNGVELQSGDSFSQADIDSRLVSYVALMPGQENLSFQLADGGEDGAAAVDSVFTISAYEPLRLVSDGSWSLSEGESVRLSESHIDATGGYFDDQDLLLTVVARPDSVEFVDAESASAVDSFSKQQLKNGSILLQHDGSEPAEEPASVSVALYRIQNDLSIYIESADIDLQLTDIANSPIGVDSTMSTDHATELVITVDQLGFSDNSDGDSLAAIAIVETPLTGTLWLEEVKVEAGDIVTVEAIEQRTLVYRPNAATVGSITETIVLRLIDSGDTTSGGVNISDDTYSIAINVVSDHNPVAQPDTIVVKEGTAVSVLASGDLSVIDNDTDLDTSQENLRVVLVDSPEHGEIVLNANGTFTYQHDRSETVSDRFSYRITDDVADTANSETNTPETEALQADDQPENTAKAWVGITVEPVDDSPRVGQLEDRSIIAGRYFEFSLTDDLFQAYYEGDELTIAAMLSDSSELPKWLHFDPVTRVFSGVPNINPVDTLEIRVTATDPDNASVQADFTVSIEPAIDAAEDVAVPEQGQPRAETASSASTVKAAAATGDQSGNARQSAVDLRQEATNEETPAPVESALFVFSDNTVQRQILTEFEDKIVKHIDKKIFRDEPAIGALIADPLDAQELRQLYFSNDEFQVKSAKKIIDQLDRNREDLATAIDQNKLVFSGATTVSVGLSISYVLWLVKSGALLSSALSAMPAWRLIDPVPILHEYGGDGDGEDESLESMVEEQEDAVTEDEAEIASAEKAGENSAGSGNR